MGLQQRPNAIVSHFRCGTYKELSKRFKMKAQRVLTGTGESFDQLASSLTDGFRREIDPRALTERCVAAGFDPVWFDNKKHHKNQTQLEAFSVLVCNQSCENVDRHESRFVVPVFHTVDLLASGLAFGIAGRAWFSFIGYLLASLL
jgi:hypothetical protein